MRKAKKAKKTYHAKITVNDAGGRVCRPMLPGIVLNQIERSFAVELDDTLHYKVEWSEKLECVIIVPII